MANPATLLAQQLRAWNGTANQSAKSMRGGWQGSAGWDHLRAVQHLVAIDECLKELELQGRSTASFREYWDSWIEIIFNPSRAWENSGSAGMSKHALLSLESLGVLFDQAFGEIQPSHLDELLHYVEQVENAVKIDDSIPKEMATHLLNLVNHIRWCVANFETVGDFDLKVAVSRLEAEVIRASRTSQKGYYWRYAVSNFALPFTVSVLASPVGTALNHAITGG